MCDSENTSLQSLVLARKATSEKHFAKAAKIFTEVLDKKSYEEEAANNGLPSRSKILCERAEMYLKISEAWKCIKDAQEAIQLEPKNIQGFCLLSAGYLQLKLLGHAEVEVKRGLKVDGENKELKRLLGEIQQDEKRFAPVRERDGSERKMRDLQNRTGWDLDIASFPEIVKCIIIGKVTAVKDFWSPSYLKMKITPLKTPLIQFPVIGRQRITPKLPAKDYCDVIDFLFEQGMRLDHCDKVGYTALMHAAGPAAEPELLEHLLKKGADPNVQSVYGTVALFDACQAQNEKIINLLLQHGADPNIMDNNGLTPLLFVQPFKKLLAVFDKYIKKETIERVCMNCESRSGISRCKSCRYVFYCSKECQIANWPSHKEKCKLIKKSHMRLKVEPGKPFFTIISNTAEVLMNNMVSEQYRHLPRKGVEVKQFKARNFEEFENSWKKGGNILKLQIHCGEASEDENINKILLYNKNKELVFHCSTSELNGPEVVECIKEKGFKGFEGTHGVKAYFLGFVEKPEEIVVITEPMLPAQPW